MYCSKSGKRKHSSNTFLPCTDNNVDLIYRVWALCIQDIGRSGRSSDSKDAEADGEYRNVRHFPQIIFRFCAIWVKVATVSVLSQMNPSHPVSFTSILVTFPSTPRSSRWSLPFRFFQSEFVALSHLYHAPCSTSEHTGFFCVRSFSPRPIHKLEDCPLSAVRNCLFSIFAAILYTRGRLLHPQPEGAPW
jgi:hypothetical protein